MAGRSRRISFGVLATLMLLLGAAHAAEVRLAYLDNAEHRRVAEALKAVYEESVFDAAVTLVPLPERQAPAMILQWLATGEVADVFYLPVEYIGSLKGNRLLLPLDALRWPSTPLRDLFDRFPPGMQLAYAEGRVPIGIPLTASASIFQYNEELFAGAGVPPLDDFSLEWTWRELLDVGRRVAAPFERRYALDIDVEFAGVYFMVHGDIVTPDGMSSNILNEANLGILELARDAIHVDRISLPPSQQNNEQRRFENRLLALNKVNIQELHPARIAQARSRIPFGWNTALWPRSPFSGERPALGLGAGLVVGWGARSLPDVSRLLDFAARPETQLKVAQAAGVIPAIPQLVSALGYSPTTAGLVQRVLVNWRFLSIPLAIVPDGGAILAPLEAALNNALEPLDALQRLHVSLQAALDAAYRK